MLGSKVLIPHRSPVPAPSTPLQGRDIAHAGRVWQSIKDNVIMKATLAIIILGASVLMAGGANAYRSNANGTQAYPNPDRETYVNRSCCSWKTSKKGKHTAAKH
jgi:hypothetical protein